MVVNMTSPLDNVDTMLGVIFTFLNIKQAL